MIGLLGRLWHLLRCFWYAARLALCGAYSLALFASKPGARFLIPVGLWLLLEFALSRSAVIWGYEALRTETGALLPTKAMALYRGSIAPHLPTLDPMIGVYVLLIAFAVLLWVFSRAIRPIIGALPPPRRPLPPIRRRRRKNEQLRPVRARRAVPRLNHALWSGEFAPMVQRLPTPVGALLIGERPAPALPEPSKPTPAGQGRAAPPLPFELEPEAS